jgi:hypothetical protein
MWRGQPFQISPRAPCAIRPIRTSNLSVTSCRFSNNWGADEVIIPEYEGGLPGRMIQKYYPAQGILD